MTPPLHRLLQRQCDLARTPAGDIDLAKLLPAISAAYTDHERDLKRIDRANALMAEELAEMLEIREMALRERTERIQEMERAQAAITASELRIRHLAYHDALTDLPNRTLFAELLESAIQSAKRHDRQCAVLFIDLDRFKLINDSLGHAAGDLLLKEMATRLRAGLRASDVVARIGGDEFLVLLPEIPDAKLAAAVAESLAAAIGQPIELSGQECHVTASIGVAMFPHDGADANTLTQHADLAMYLAKTEGKNGVRLFSPQIATPATDRLAIEADLRHALARGEFVLHYQPKLDLKTDQLCGVEALLRWNHPKLGPLSPSKFIPVAEESDLIFSIGAWVIRTACAQNMAWQRRGLLPISMAVNVSPRQFMDDNLLSHIDEALASSHMEARYLQIEVTESMVMLNIERAIQILDSIHRRRVRLAIDDFGTGYSSMSMLKRFPIDTIKIDKSFVGGLSQTYQDKAIAQAIISMGKALGLTIVAEGVETTEQVQFLRDHQCDEIQGFLFSQPLAADQLAEMLRLPILAAAS